MLPSLIHVALGLVAALLYNVGLANASLTRSSFDLTNYACHQKPAIVYMNYISDTATRFGIYGIFDGQEKYGYKSFGPTNFNLVGAYVYNLTTTATVYAFVRQETGSPTWTDLDEREYIAGKKDLVSGVTYTFFYGTKDKDYNALTSTSPKSFSIDPCGSHENPSYEAWPQSGYFTVGGSA